MNYEKHLNIIYGSSSQNCERQVSMLKQAVQNQKRYLEKTDVSNLQIFFRKALCFSVAISKRRFDGICIIERYFPIL